MNDFTNCRELKPYQVPTKAMRLGAPGKYGMLDLVFESQIHYAALGKTCPPDCTTRIVL